ncbi:phosphatase PAP2 family protein [Mesoterricola silvestris]|uniref:Acid phosphatase n=1 Tax=Mesoterricola silvestris TaxID=2927979 RepID=A0AA48GK17_9BACT|nr:phosphatase PAP2 family protein [Mesoterricola silvestris]BDU72762.1 acid phosphatase [Mesoterricola silvestris]
MKAIALLALPMLLLAGWTPAQAQARRGRYPEATRNFVDAATLDLSALPAPPLPGTLAAEADLETILQLQAWRTEAEVAWARGLDHLDIFAAGAAVGPWFTRAALPRCAQFLEEALGDGEHLNKVAKLTFRRLRPPYFDARVKPCVPILPWPKGEPPAGFYSYPSGHSTSIFILVELLGELVPDRREALTKWAHRAAWSRMLAGMHFPSDDMGGKHLAAIAVKAMRTNPAFRESMAACAQEIQAARPAQGIARVPDLRH